MTGERTELEGIWIGDGWVHEWLADPELPDLSPKQAYIHAGLRLLGIVERLRFQHQLDEEGHGQRAITAEEAEIISAWSYEDTAGNPFRANNGLAVLAFEGMLERGVLDFGGLPGTDDYSPGMERCAEDMVARSKDLTHRLVTHNATTHAWSQLGSVAV